MGATTRPRSAPLGAWLERFDPVERAVHWVTAVLFLVLVLTGAALYLQPLGQLVGRRALVENIHVWCGVALPVPLLLAVAGPWGRALRADLRRLNRWTAPDREWLHRAVGERSLRRPSRSGADAGKFNGGQKLNSAWTAGAGLVMLGTGAIMRWYHPWPLAWRTGATFVHDWTALAVGLVIIGHVVMAAGEPESLRSMVSGRVPRRWAERHAPGWADGRDG
jgi:formate dehydrogenase subunit gamma